MLTIKFYQFPYRTPFFWNWDPIPKNVKGQICTYVITLILFTLGRYFGVVASWHWKDIVDTIKRLQDPPTPEFSTPNFNPWLLNPRFVNHEHLKPKPQLGWKVHGWKVWGWEVRGWNIQTLIGSRTFQPQTFQPQTIPPWTFKPHRGLGWRS